MDIAIIILLVLSIFVSGTLTIKEDIKININWFSLIALILVLIKFYN